MDLLQGRQPEEVVGTKYLNFLPSDPSEIHSIDDLFLARLLYSRRSDDSNNELYAQRSIQKLIDR